MIVISIVVLWRVAKLLQTITIVSEYVHGVRFQIHMCVLYVYCPLNQLGFLFSFNIRFAKTDLIYIINVVLVVRMQTMHINTAVLCIVSVPVGSSLLKYMESLTELELLRL